jgi:histidinol-phosphate aminotransferase
VDKIFGPGNLFVTLAKRQVYGAVGIDSLAGPTETVVVADDTARPEWVAADLLAQAEHDVIASAILLTPSRQLAEAVQMEVARQVENLSRAEIIAASLASRGGAVLTADLGEAVALANTYAPEHLCLCVADPWRWMEKVTAAGGIFLGEHSFEVLGDYVAGPSHVMPTGGTARFASPLNVLDFIRITSIIALDEASAAAIAPHAANIARAEGLDSHAQAAIFRVNADAVSKTASVPTPRFLPEGEEGEAYSPVVPFEVYAAQVGLPPEKIVKLDANENPYGPSKSTLAKLAAGRMISIYPDPENTLLRKRLGEFLDLPMERLFAGSGEDEVIDVILRAVLEPGDVVVDCPPTFTMYSFDTGINRGRLWSVGRRADFSLDPDAIEAAVRAEPRAKVLFVCSPNNPDGSVVDDDTLRRLLRLPVLVVLDEAYVEFSGGSRIRWALDYPNLAVLRTFSKWAGLAGLRVGYGALPRSLMPRMMRIKQPYNINAAAGQAAIASLDDAPALLETVGRIVAERDRMYGRLKSIPWMDVFPSRSNFFLCRLKGREPREVQKALAGQGILIRYFNKPGVRDCLRISVGRPEDTERLIQALEEQT